MSELSGALAIAGSGLLSVKEQLETLSQNIANVNTPGYDIAYNPVTDVGVNGQLMGVITGPAVTLTDPQATDLLLGQMSTNSYWQTTSTALSGINAVAGSPGSSNNLSGDLTALQNAFSSLETNPASAPGQDAVVEASQTVAGEINTLSQTYTQTRQNIQDTLVSNISSLNSALKEFGILSNQIVAAKSAGIGTATLVNHRNAVMQQISTLVSVKFLSQPDGNMTVITSSGTMLPTNPPGQSPLVTETANMNPQATYPGTIPGITLNGVDITNSLTGGTIGAELTMRDYTIPKYQATLDEFSHNLATRMAAQGLSLFTNSKGQIPSSTTPPVQSGYVGFSSEITVNPAIVSDPALVRDGNLTIPGSPTGASAFTPNPVGGPAGFTTLIDRILQYGFGSDVQKGVPQPAENTTGLGPLGNIDITPSEPNKLGTMASDLISQQSGDTQNAAAEGTAAKNLQTVYQKRLTGEVGVNLDKEVTVMIGLQTAYAANARVITSVQTMFQDLLSSVGV